MQYILIVIMLKAGQVHVIEIEEIDNLWAGTR
jgi:hypothetical protein